MNQTNIPPVNQANRPLVSVGNGNQVKWGDFPVVQQTIPTTTGGSTLPTGTGTGQMIWWNGTAWVVTSTPASGKYFYWNGTAWVGGTAGDATKIQGYSVNVTGLTTSGQMLFWTNLGGTGQWVTTYVPTGTGSMLFWNGTSWESTSTTGLTTNYVMTWNGTAWVPAAGGNTLAGYAVNVSALNPTTDTGAMLTFNYNSFTGLSQWVETYVPTGTGSMFFWNGTNWESTSTTSIATGNTLIWNGSTSKWAPGNITLSGEVTGNTSSTSVVKLISYLLPVTGAINGNFLYYTNISGTGKWEYGGYNSSGSSPSVGDVLIWNATTGWTAGPVSSTPSLLNNSTGSMFQNTSTNVTNTIARVDNMASNFVNGSVTFNGSGGSYPYSLKVPTTGYYQVDGQVYIAAGTATGGYVISLIYVNGSEVMRANSYGTGGAAPHCGGVIALNANDYVQLYAQVQSGTAATSVVSGSLRTFVSLSLVSQ